MWFAFKNRSPLIHLSSSFTRLVVVVSLTRQFWILLAPLGSNNWLETWLAMSSSPWRAFHSFRANCNPQSSLVWFLTSCYGPNDRSSKKVFFDEIIIVNRWAVGPWVLIGGHLVYRWPIGDKIPLVWSGLVIGDNLTGMKWTSSMISFSLLISIPYWQKKFHLVQHRPSEFPQARSFFSLARMGWSLPPYLLLCPL